MFNILYLYEYNSFSKYLRSSDEDKYDNFVKPKIA